jgi:hypothetical protein
MRELGIGRPKIKPEQVYPPLLEHQDLDSPYRLKLWEIEYFFKCPVVGICLTSSEQRQVLKKAGISFKRRSAFEIHEILVGGAEKKGRLAEKMDNLLNRKFAHEIASLLDLDETSFMARWETCFHSGEYAGAFWAAATRPDLSIQARRQIFGTIHMAMHANAGKDATLRRRLAYEKERAEKMILKAKEAHRSRKSLQKAQADLTGRLADSEKEQVRLKNELEELKRCHSGLRFERQNAELKADLKGLSREMREKEGQIVVLRAENSMLSSEIDRQRGLSERFQKEARELVKAMVAQKRCDATCPSFDLCKRRVLIVGGLTKMEALYRQMIEDGGGIFEYHDGYVRNGLRNLENRLRRADIVLCPTSCNSHAACSLVKSLGKKHNKPVCILVSSSLSAMAQALSGKGGVYASGN